MGTGAAIVVKNDEICGNLDSFNQEKASKKAYSHEVIEVSAVVSCSRDLIWVSIQWVQRVL